jgi:hypothetical protein
LRRTQRHKAAIMVARANRLEARARGWKKFEGAPCGVCSGQWRYVSSRGCVDCLTRKGAYTAHRAATCRRYYVKKRDASLKSGNTL